MSWLRLKSVAANLLFGAFCFGWPLFMGLGSSAFGLFLALFLWPLGTYYLYRAVTGQIEEAFLPRAPPPERNVRVAPSGNVYEDNREALLRWVGAVHPGWPQKKHLEFAEFVARHFNEERWNGSNRCPRFSEAVTAYIVESRGGAKR